MSKRPLFGAFCCAMLLSSSTWAATLEPGQGNLSINRGQGFQPVNGRITANVGDSVMVDPGGSATIVYDDGCKVPVQPGAVATITPLSPCASGSNAQDFDVDWGGVALGVGAAGAAGWATYQAVKSPSSGTQGATP